MTRAPFWRATPKIVFSRSYPGDDWTERVIHGDLQAEVTALKAEPGGDLLLTGGANLAAALTGWAGSGTSRGPVGAGSRLR